MENYFTASDKEIIKSKENTVEHIKAQLTFFKNGVKVVNCVKPATINDGILSFSSGDILGYASYFEGQKENLEIIKMVPASGAATRMFKELFEFLQKLHTDKKRFSKLIQDKKHKKIIKFFLQKKRFPFYKEIVNACLIDNPNYLTLSFEEQNLLFLNTMLFHLDFNFANKPKAVLPFHTLNNSIITPIESQCKEVLYCNSITGKPKIHFTISQEHQDYFNAIIKNIDTVDISFSYQNKNTDTIAVNENNTPFRDENNNIVFRPGGHGALIHNLNNLDADIIFIKNIDNVTPNFFNKNIRYKKALGGILLQLQSQVFEYLKGLEINSKLNLDDVKQFAIEKLNIDAAYFSDIKTLKERLIELLNRPIRVCGMVKNEGEPGGGPFWVKNSNGFTSLQIIESSQIDVTNEEQFKIAAEATHFNPVDLVCGVKNYKGEKFDLTQFVDVNTGFIVHKTKDGKPLKGYELPGLWNGAMANWNTIFVEVPLATFNPVKSINDLLNRNHQPQIE